MTFSIGKERITALSSDGTPMGYITFPQIRKDLVNINLMVTYPNFRGQGVPDKLMEALLTHLEQNGQKAALNCPFTQYYLQQNSQWKHLLPGKMHFTTC